VCCAVLLCYSQLPQIEIQDMFGYGTGELTDVSGGGSNIGMSVSARWPTGGGGRAQGLLIR
jgi:hypothetical protein